MPHLILVKHARPAIDPAAPARAWRLGEAGRHGALALAASLGAFGPTRLSASPEPKAAETAPSLCADTRAWRRGASAEPCVSDASWKTHRLTGRIWRCG